jgi:transcriptional regulator with XRE-family HTH domain
MEEERIAPQLARFLREWRESRRGSQRVLAEFTGVSQSLVSRAEQGLDLRLSSWEKLFGALGCRLIVSVEETDYAEECEDYLQNETERRLYNKLDALGPR